MTQPMGLTLARIITEAERFLGFAVVQGESRGNLTDKKVERCCAVP